MKLPIYQRVADELQRRVEKNPRTPLPSIDNLALEWNVSYRTMWKAVRLLTERKVLLCSQGKRTMPVAATNGRVADASSGRLFDKIQNGISNGLYPVGTVLPKVTHFVLSDHVSPNTVIRTLRRLQAAGLAHRQGKRWIAGRRSASVTLAPGRRVEEDAPVIAVLFGNADEWENFVSWPHTAGFAMPFINEISCRGFQITVAAVVRPEAPSMVVPAGLDGIKSHLRSLGSRYYGALVVPTEPYTLDFEECMLALCSLGKPILHFDCSNQGSRLTRAVVPFRRYYRLFFDEPSALKCVVARLAELGHENVGVPVFTHRRFAWTDRRFMQLKDMADRIAPAMHLEPSWHTERFWHFEIMGTLQQFVSRVEKEWRRRAGKWTSVRDPVYRAMLLQESPSMVSLLCDRQVTALIALNDRMAREYYFWLKTAGIEIPSELSLISFDNATDSAAIPVSTVDFGFSRLGYLAAHIFIGDIPVKADRLGNIAGVCTLHERGSLGPPRRGRLSR